MADNVNVLFKRGTQANLNKILNKATDAPSVVDGAFYLTNDTHRLYIGQGQNMVLLNQTVQFVESISKLTEMSAAWASAGTEASHVNDLYYILPGVSGTSTDNDGKGGNILAVFIDKGNNTYAWQQINPDHNTTNSEIKTFIDIVSGAAVFNTELRDNAGNSVDSSFKIGIGKNSNNENTISLSTIDGGTEGNNDTLVIKGDTYTLNGSVSNGVGVIGLTSALGQSVGDGAKIVAGTNVSIIEGSNANEIKIKASDWQLIEEGSSLVADDTGKLTLSLANNAGNPVEVQSDVIGYRLNSKSTSIIPLGSNSSSNNILDVYSTGDIDKMFKDLNGLTYIGTVGKDTNSAGTYYISNGSVLKTANDAPIEVHNGDMFLVCDNNSPYGADSKASQGDLLIAQGIEDSSGVLTTINWTYIPSGDEVEVDTTYKMVTDTTNNKISIEQESNNDPIGSISVKSGTAIEVETTGSDVNDLVLTVNHADIDGEQDDQTSGTAINPTNLSNGDNTSTFDAVSAVTFNDQGHVTKVTTSRYNLPKYTLDNAAVISSSNGSKTLTKVVYGLKKGGGTAVTENGFAFDSSSLAITADTTNSIVNIELNWGTF